MESLKKIRSGNQKKFFGFVNADIAGMERSEFVPFLFSYEELLQAFSDRFQSASIASKREKLVADVNVASDDNFQQMKEDFLRLQDFLLEKLKDILGAVKYGDTNGEPIITISGKQELRLDLGADCFTLQPVPIVLSDGLNLEKDKKVLELIFVSMFTEYNLKPSRLYRCEREKCGNIFFRHTTGTKYCSSRCSNAELQATKRAKDKAEK